MLQRQILATSAGFRATGLGPYRVRRGPMINHALRLTGKPKPKVCYVATAGGDNHNEILAVYGAFAGADDASLSHLELFSLPNVANPREHLLSQDVIWVGGGSVANLLAVWRVHGLDDVFREAWEQGILLGGVSAGSLCWHIGGTTDSFGLDLRPVTNGLGFLPFSNGVHYDSEAQRRPLFQRLIGEGTLPSGYATDDGVGIHYVGTEFHEAVTSLPEKSAYFVERVADGEVQETVITPRLLPE